MKERIKELIVQSGNGQFHNGKCYPHIGSRTLEDWTKFAELIVKECMDVVDTGENQVIARFQARQWLAEHFGIE
jgi:hypothetical protein